MKHFDEAVRLSRRGAQWSALWCGLAGSAAAWAAAPVYHIEAIPIQNGVTPTKAYGINSHGDVVGTGYGTGMPVCFKYVAGVVSELPNSYEGACTSINDAGDVVGVVYINNKPRGAAWPASGSGRVLLPMNSAWAVNSLGQIAGQADFDGAQHAAVWQNGALTDLGTLGGPASSAIRLTDSGKVVGFADNAEGHSVPAAWENGEVQEVCRYDGASHTSVYDVNENGQLLCLAVVGSNQFAFIEDGSGQHVIPPFKTFGMYGRGLNDHGEVVGMMFAPQQAFYSNGKKTFKLESLLDNKGKWQALRDASAINNAGQIVGTGKLGRKDTAFIATPVTR